jgi:site-specific DNA recombinase
MTIRAAGYLRLSKADEGDSLGIERQRESVMHLAKAKGWVLDENWLIVENNTSASNKRLRPGFERLIQGMRDGQFDALLAYAVDRIVRRLDDLVRLIDTAEEFGVLVATTTGELDLSTGQGRGFAKLQGVVASMETDTMGERMRAKKRQNARSGSLAGGGRRPYGFTTDRTEVVPAEVEVIRRVTRQILAGKTLTAVARDLNREGVPTSYGGTWTLPRLQGTLKRPSLCGRVMYKGAQVRDDQGKPVRGEWGYRVKLAKRGDKVREKPVNGRAGKLVRTKRWDPILSEDDFDALQIAMKARKQHPDNWSQRRVHLLSGLARCGRCDAPMIGFRSSKGSWTYQCQAMHHLSRVKAPLDEFVIGQVKARAAETVFNVDSFSSEEAQQVRRGIGVLEERKADAIRELVGGKIGPSDLSAMIAEFDSRIEALRGSQVGRAVEAQNIDAVQFDLDRFDDMPVEEQHTAIRMFVTRIVVRPAGSGRHKFDPTLIDIEWRDPDSLRWRGVVEAGS